MMIPFNFWVLRINDSNLFDEIPFLCERCVICPLLKSGSLCWPYDLTPAGDLLIDDL